MSGNSNHDRGRPTLLSMNQIRDPGHMSRMSPHLASVYQSISQWITSYLMSNHSELGRSGDVCPFTAQASRLDTIRIGVSDAAGADSTIIKSITRYAFDQFSLIPCTPPTRHFRAVLIAFPKMDNESGSRCLKLAQSQLKYDCLRRGLMLGRFHPEATDRGLWNPEFRPLRSPVPLLAVRELVENDAPFAARHPLLMPAYLYKYPVAGLKRFLTQVTRR
jgi:hypothetical protein